jgi:hypothetical protein
VVNRKLYIAQCNSRVIETFEQLSDSTGVLALTKPLYFTLRNGFYLDVKKNEITYATEADSSLLYKITSHNAEYSIVYAEREDGSQISIHGSNVQHIAFV